MRVAIADDHVLLREGLARLLAEARMDVVLQAPDAEALFAGLDRAAPDVVVLDIRLPELHRRRARAADVLRERHPTIAVLLLSQYLETAYALRLLESFPGGVGYLLKDRVSNVAVLTDAIGRVVEGECVIDPTIIARLVGKPALATSLAQLTARERDVLSLIAEGRSNRAIGSSCSSARRPSRATCAGSSTSSGSRRHRTTTAGCSPCSPSCAARALARTARRGPCPSGAERQQPEHWSGVLRTIGLSRRVTGLVVNSPPPSASMALECVAA